MEKGSAPNKHALDIAKYILDNSSKIAHMVVVSIGTDGAMSVNQTGNIPKPIHALMQAFFAEVSRQALFGRHIETNKEVEPKAEVIPMEKPALDDAGIVQ